MLNHGSIIMQEEGRYILYANPIRAESGERARQKWGSTTGITPLRCIAGRNPISHHAGTWCSVVQARHFYYLLTAMIRTSPSIPRGKE
jgi:hypothetical protein